MNKLFLFIIVLAVVFLGVFWFLGNRGGEISSPQVTLAPTQSPVSPPLSEANETLSVSPTPIPVDSPVGGSAPSPTPEIPLVAPKAVSINMTDSGFNPAEVVINAGDTIRFINQSSQDHWPASAVHPTHEFYPGSSISKCGSFGPMAIFDACRGLQKGEVFSFTFNEKGTWPYHDHLVPSAKGKVIVR